jgi:hypothetical protein
VSTDGRDQAVVLTPFAAELRYDLMPAEPVIEEPPDRAGMLRIAEQVFEWATSVCAG